MKKYLYLVVLICVVSLVGKTQVVELEHSFFNQQLSSKSKINPTGGSGGSSWGTDDLLQNSLKSLPVGQIPDLFKMEISHENLPKRIRIQLSNAHKFYRSGEVIVFNSIRVCVDKNISIDTVGFVKASQLFENKFLAESQLKFQQIDFEKLSSPNDQNQALGIQKIQSQCDIVAIRGSLTQFPYKQLSEKDHLAGAFPHLVLGLYYQFSQHTIPIIIFHPQVKMTFDEQSKPYLSQQGGEWIVDGRVLFFHELGHALGLTHIQKSPHLDTASYSLMGRENSERKEYDIINRFFSKNEMWKHFDLTQSSFYRAISFMTKSGVLDSEYRSRSFDLTRTICLYKNEIIDQHLALANFIDNGQNGVSGDLKNLPSEIEFKNTQIQTNKTQAVNLSDSIFLKLFNKSVNSDESYYLLKSFKYEQQSISIDGVVRNSFLFSSIQYQMGEKEGFFRQSGVLRSNSFLLGFWGQQVFQIVSSLNQCFQ